MVLVIQLYKENRAWQIFSWLRQPFSCRDGLPYKLNQHYFGIENL